ncbi:MAG: GIY-YIG nuclease family protein, partial [Pseudomonadota bacterium]|nr:GIY-YIG nuclease family protein [Pseudomonadota bacterium]
MTAPDPDPDGPDVVSRPAAEDAAEGGSGAPAGASGDAAEARFEEARFEEDGAARAPGETVETGAAVIRAQLRHLPDQPGVYRMLDARGEVLYVGKARSLKKRVASYARPTGHTARIARMIAATASMMFLTTNTETEALLLEQNLIKQLKPR